MPTAKQALQHRSDRDDLIEIALRDVDLLLRDFNSAEAARDALLDVLPQLYVIYGAAVATLSADWYDDVREADGVRGRFRAIPAELKADPGTTELARWGVAPLFQPEPDLSAARSLIGGGLQRRIADVSRETIMFSSVQDPQSAGWQRVGAGGCTSGFCDMLIARGAVYSEATADFAAHDHCKCSAVPAWGGQALPVQSFTPSLEQTTAADRARVREWIATNQ